MSYNGTGWALLLGLAEAYGWEPEGTAPPDEADPSEWEGDYDTNDGQEVSESDARAMADALERALADAARGPRQREIVSAMNEELRELEILAFGDAPPIEEYPVFEADDAILREAIAFLRAGSFRID